MSLNLFMVSFFSSIIIQRIEDSSITISKALPFYTYHTAEEKEKMISPEDKPSHALFIDKYGHHYIRYTYLKFSQLHLLNMILKNAFLNIINDYFDEYTFDQPDSVYI